MSQIIETQASRVELCEPWEAGEHDPKMHEWLALPLCGKDHCCPLHPGGSWGTKNPRGYFLVRRCYECDMHFRGEVTAYTIRDVVGALTGEQRRFGMGPIR